jgi:Rrf2 family protein
MISQTAEYALRAVVCLVNCPENSLTTPEIARITKVPPSYLAKVLQSLGRAKIVKSQRGLHGGFKLAKPAERISLLEVINAVDPIQTILECPLGLKNHGKKLCLLHKRLNDTTVATQEVFRRTTSREFLTCAYKGAALCKTSDSNKK